MKQKEACRSILFRLIAVTLLTALFCFLFLSSALVLYALHGVDSELDLDLLVSKQGRTTKLYYINADAEPTEWEDQRLHGTENRIWIEIGSIPENVKNAFIAIEDHRFYTHKGVDVRRTIGAMISFLLPRGSHYGGSTITQQLIKNLTGENSVTVKRKITEIMRALMLEKEGNISKDEILELYLNTVYLSQGCYGLETAAETYFGKSASTLSLAEGAALAAIIQYPTRYDPIQNPAQNTERRNLILHRMEALGMISAEECADATSMETVLHLSEKKRNEGGKNSWFTEVVIEDVIHDLSEKYSMTRNAAAQMIYNGGLSIYTTMDLKMQKELEAFYQEEKNFPKNTAGMQATSSCVIIDPKTGHLLAVAGDVGPKRSDRILNLATQMLRSPGSVIKPISVYAPALDNNLITWSTVLDDVPVSFSEENEHFVAWPKNNPRVYNGLTTIHTAMIRSTNTVPVRILQTLGIERSFDFAVSAGLSTLVAEEKSENGKIFSDKALAPLALGATTRGVSVREMTGAYTMLADRGIYHQVISYVAVYDKNGKLLLSQEKEGAQLIGADTAAIMTKLLEDVVVSGTASAITLKNTVAVAGKTGTSNANTDRWFIGYTPDLLCGVWYGYKDGHDIGTHKKNPAVLIFDDIMRKLYDEQASDLISLSRNHAFPENENVKGALYCQDSGYAPSAACSHDPRGHRIALGYFKKGTEPRSQCETHILVDYDAKTKAVACENCPKENCVKIALLRHYGRNFPCEVHITDAQYIYRHLPFGTAPTADRNKAFFQNAYEKGNFIGTSSTANACNRYCIEHQDPTEDETVPETKPETATIPPLFETEKPSETTTQRNSSQGRRPPWWR